MKKELMMMMTLKFISMGNDLEKCVFLQTIYRSKKFSLGKISKFSSDSLTSRTITTSYTNIVFRNFIWK